MTTPTAPPTLTGRRLVELLVARSGLVVSAREFVGAETAAPDGPVLDGFYQRGDILPPGLNPDCAAHLTRQGLVECVTVRI